MKHFCYCEDEAGGSSLNCCYKCAKDYCVDCVPKGCAICTNEEVCVQHKNISVVVAKKMHCANCYDGDEFDVEHCECCRKDYCSDCRYLVCSKNWGRCAECVKIRPPSSVPDFKKRRKGRKGRLKIFPLQMNECIKTIESCTMKTIA